MNSLAYGAGIKINPNERDPVTLAFIPRCGDAVARMLPSIAVVTLLSMFGASPGGLHDDYDMPVLRVRSYRLMKHLKTILGRKPRLDLEFVQSLKAGSSAWQEWAVISHLLAALDASSGRSLAPKHVRRAESSFARILGNL
ncbi:hypothetical protein [Bradyrhizobium sp. LTSPM299]|uniref:hypothetical protein n=1 Tax=Bradyrhizobium sp. LTSPM299 TaxID=1619233 RepID=UPI0012E27898|nr:hypothetical protein [Bradyrhizobium sp. LTSPM299]